MQAMAKRQTAKPTDFNAAAESRPQAAYIHSTLAEDILLGRLAPGTFLSEARISDRFGVSRTPVREAIRALAADGLVILRPRQRAVVRGQTAVEIIDQFEAMAELESACARLAAQRRSADDLALLHSAQSRCRTQALAGDLSAYYDANVHFHEAIYVAGGNQYLRTETLRLRDRLGFMRITQGQLPGRMESSSLEHDTVLTAIRDRDGDAAGTAMRRHLIIQGESLRRMLRHTDASGFVHIADMRLQLDLAWNEGATG